MTFHAGGEKGGKDGGGTTRARSCWASGESSVGGAGAESSDGSDECGAAVWAGVRREIVMPHWRQPATTTAAPCWSDAGVGMRAYLDFVLWGARLKFCGVSGAYSRFYCCLSGFFLYYPSLLYFDHLVYSFACP